MTVLLSHGGRNLYQSTAPDGELAVGTVNGIVFATKGAGGWAVSRRAMQGKHISGLMQTVNGTMFAGVHKGGLWASEDFGDTWERRDQGIASDNIYAMNWCTRPNNIRIFAGTEPAHLYYSDTMGHAWTELPGIIEAATTSRWTFPAPPHVAHIKNINFDPRSVETMYVAVEQGGLYKSTNAGVSFRELSGFDDDVHRVVMSPLEPDHLYITTGIGAYHSTDAGETWSQITGRKDRIGYPDAIIPHPGQLGYMFHAGARWNPGEWRTTHDADGAIASSTDGGKTWDWIEGRGLPAHIQGNVEAMCMNDWGARFALFAGTTDGEVFLSEDGGATWQGIIAGVAPVSKGGHYYALQTEAPELIAAR